MMIKNSIETPGRLYEYMGSAKPLLLMLPDGALKQIGREYKASFMSNPKDVNSIVKHLNNIYHLWRENKLPVPDAEYINTYNRYNLTELLAKELSFATMD